MVTVDQLGGHLKVDNISHRLELCRFHIRTFHIHRSGLFAQMTVDGIAHVHIQVQVVDPERKDLPLETITQDKQNSFTLCNACRYEPPPLQHDPRPVIGHLRVASE